MTSSRKLVLRSETLTELSADQLRGVVAGEYTVPVTCGGLTVLVHGCPSDPRVCHYVTDFC